MKAKTEVPHKLKTSVIIPTLNEAARISVLLRALEAQTYPIEVIVCDGGSTDGTPDIVREFPDVTLIESERGTSRQRNVGAQYANGDLLIWMDADDVPTPDFVVKVVASYQRLPFAVACPWFVAHDSGLGVRAIYFVFNLLFFAGQGWLRMGSGVCVIAPKNIFETTGGFDENLHLGEDIHFIRRAGRCGLHRHLLVPLETSGRRFEQKGIWQLVKFYARITPLLWMGRWDKLKGTAYEAAPYQESR